MHRRPLVRIAGLVLAALGIATAPIVRATDPPAPGAAPTLTVAQAEYELRILRRALESLHPGLHRRQSPEQFAAEFARAQAAVADGSDVLEMYRLASRIAAVVRCGHTWTNTVNQGPAVTAALSALPALPVRIRVLEGRWLVTASADPAIPAGVEILRIDGRTPGAVTAALLPYLRADGESDGKRIDQLDSGGNGGALDRLLPQLFPPGAEGYRILFQRPGGDARAATVSGMPVATREAALAAAGVAAESSDWRLELADGTAILTVPTFAFWRSEFDWRGFLERSFARIEREGIERLVLDLRDNEGGDNAIADALLAHVLAAPLEVPGTRRVSAYERAPYILVRFLDTWDYDFFDRTGQVRKAADGSWTLVEASNARRIDPVARPFRGRVAMLTGPRMSSSGFLVARDFKASGRGVLVGRPTGGSLRGLNGGQLAWLTLPTSGVAVDIPLLANFAAGVGTPDAPPDRGVLPDIAVSNSLEDAAAGRDAELAAARRWLAEPAEAAADVHQAQDGIGRRRVASLSAPAAARTPAAASPPGRP